MAKQPNPSIRPPEWYDAHGRPELVVNPEIHGPAPYRISRRAPRQGESPAPSDTPRSKMPKGRAQA